MPIILSNRTLSVAPSATVTINAKAQQLQSQGVDIINLSIGEPDFDTPNHIKQAAINAIHAGHTKYTAVGGIPELKEAVIAKFKRENQLNYQPNQILVSCGGKHSLYNLAQAILNPGDEVIIPSPYWLSYPAMARLAEAIPVLVATTKDQHFKITPEQLEQAITPKTRLFILNSPSNPTGMAYSADELKALGDVLQKHPHVLIASDDIYEHILWGLDHFVNILNVCPELFNQIIIFNGASKSYAMTGWRIGYAAGPKEIISAMNTVQSHSTSNPTSISQYAVIAALNGHQDFLFTLRKTFYERYVVVHQALNAINGVDCPKADGAFYLFPDVRAAIARHRLKNDVELTQKILEESHVAVVPGTEFGAPGFIRISYANSIEYLRAAIERMTPIIQG